MFCPGCGTEAAADHRFCSNCGRELGIGAGAALAPGLVTAAGGTAGPYAGFWRRFAGWLVDVGVFYAVFMAGMLMMVAVIGFPEPDAPTSPPPAGPVFSFILGIWLVPLLYMALMESSRYQATLGKLAVGIKVTDLAGQRISLGRSFGRTFAHFLTGFTFFGGYLMAAFTDRRQALHDMVAGTIVVTKEFVPSVTTVLPAAARMPRWALVLAVLAGLVPLGLMAAIFVPAYQDYTVRLQVTEGLNLATAYRNDVTNLALADGGPELGDINSESLGITTEASSAYVDAIEIRRGSVVIRYGKQAHESLQGRQVVQRAIPRNDGIVWVCGRARLAGSPTVPTDPGAAATTVSDKYLPMSCRRGYVIGEE